MRKFEDLTGQKFGRLTVIERAGKAKNGHTKWLCQCDCMESEPFAVTVDHLKSGHTKSCGCLKKEMTSKAHKKYNEYRSVRNYEIGFTSKNEPFFFDIEDFDKIKDYCWYVQKNGYIVNKNDNAILMHILLMNPPEDMVVDHKNYRKYDNRKSELRICTHQQNIWNNPKTKGYSYYKRDKKWVVKIEVDSIIYKKYFSTEAEAAACRKELEQLYYGEFAPHEPKPLPPELQQVLDDPQWALDNLPVLKIEDE